MRRHESRLALAVSTEPAPALPGAFCRGRGYWVLSSETVIFVAADQGVGVTVTGTDPDVDGDTDEVGVPDRLGVGDASADVPGRGDAEVGALDVLGVAVAGGAVVRSCVGVG
jgi:hypothetical protein